jgi:hypothetical protein
MLASAQSDAPEIRGKIQHFISVQGGSIWSSPSTLNVVEPTTMRGARLKLDLR